MWNPENYPGVQTIRFPSSQVWVPDILLYNRYGGLLLHSLTAIVLLSFMSLPSLTLCHFYLISFVLRSLCTSSPLSCSPSPIAPVFLLVSALLIYNLLSHLPSLCLV